MATLQVGVRCRRRVERKKTLPEGTVQRSPDASTGSEYMEVVTTVGYP